MNRVKVGVVGIGEVGTNHSRVYASLAEKAELVGIADPDGDRVRPFAEELGVRYLSDFEQLLASGVDAVTIASPQTLHLDHVTLAAAAGKHVLLEKPMAMSLAEADEIIAACHRADTKLMLGFTHRFHSEIRRAKELIAAGKLGDISMGIDSMSFCGHGWKAWNWSQELAGGGPMMRDGVHGIDRLRWLIGSEVKEVYAKKGTYAHPQADVEDNAAAILEFENGAIATMIQSWNDYYAPTHCDLHLYGTRGLVRINTWRSIQFNSFEEGWVQTRSKGEQNLRSEVEAFLDCIIDDTEPPITGEDGKVSLAVILAIYESARSGQPVSMASFE